MSMIEKVARAICVCAQRDPDLQGIQSPFGDITPMPAGYRQWQNYEAEARAAIKSMREPTQRMEDAGQKSCAVDAWYSEAVWQAMIDAALKETE